MKYYIELDSGKIKTIHSGLPVGVDVIEFNGDLKGLLKRSVQLKKDEQPMTVDIINSFQT